MAGVPKVLYGGGHGLRKEEKAWVKEKQGQGRKEWGGQSQSPYDDPDRVTHLLEQLAVVGGD